MARATGDVVGFRRIFILFCTLVLLPAMLLSGFGIVAVRNERTAAKQRQREHAEGILDVVERDLVTRLRDLDAHFAEVADDSLQKAVQQRRSTGDIVADAFVIDIEGRVVWADPSASADGVTDELMSRIQKVKSSVPDGSVAHMAQHDGLLAGVLAVQRRQSENIFIYRLDEGRLAERLLAIPDEEITVVLKRDAEPDAFIVVETWMRELVESGGSPAALRNEITRRALPQPFDRMALVAVGPAPRTTMSVIYIVLLIVFYAFLITGVVITSRLIWQETRISRLKTDFVSHVSHELRTPLTSIRMFIETLRLGRAQSLEEQAECLDLLGQETERLSEMIERVLGYARLESGRRIFHHELTPVRDLVDDAVQAFRAHTLGDETAKGALSLEIPDDLPRVDVDREAMTEALLNLMGNAYKYTGAEKRIRVVASRQGKRVAIAVVDNGPGIPKAEWRRIFDRFYQSGQLLSREKGGSGLGLAIARRIVDGHRGRITVVSAPGQGSTFTIELPIAKNGRATI